jgi:hypothetical protein
MYYYIYVLQSAVDFNFYVGYTKNLANRLEKHNKGEVFFNKEETSNDLSLLGRMYKPIRGNSKRKIRRAGSTKSIGLICDFNL